MYFMYYMYFIYVQQYNKCIIILMYFVLKIFLKSKKIHSKQVIMHNICSDNA